METGEGEMEKVGGWGGGKMEKWWVGKEREGGKNRRAKGGPIYMLSLFVY